MFLNLKKIKKIILNPDAKIYDVIKNLAGSGLRIVLIVDKKKNFIGVLNDGDIRRSFLRGSGLNSSIKNIINKKAIFINKKIIINKKFRDIDFEKINEPIPVIKNKKIIGLHTVRKMKSDPKKILPLMNVGLVIMSGGKGSRLKLLTKKIPKPLLFYKSKTLIEYVIDNAKNQGFKNFFISVFYLKNKIKKFFKKNNNFNQKISFIEEKKPMGTIGSLSLIKNISSSFIVLNCDVISNINLRDLYSSHIKSKSLMTVTVKKIKLKNPYGTVISKGKKLLSIKEKPELNIDINAGVYVFNKKIIKLINKLNFQTVDQLINYLVSKKRKINIFHMTETWQDFGQDFETLKKFNKLN